MKRLSAFAFACLLPYTAQAAEISVTAEGGPDHPALILIKGQIAKDDAAANAMTFKVIAGAQKHGALVFLDVIGGSVIAAIEIGRSIRANGFSTLVGDNATCSSACGLIWLGGKERFLGPHAQVGFHAARVGTTNEVSSVGNALIGAYLYEIGITNVRTIAFLTMASPQTMNWVTLDTTDARLWFDIKPLKGELALQLALRPIRNNDADAPMAFKVPAPVPAERKVPLTGDAHGFVVPNHK
jgi:hypothetical protein